MNDNKKSVLIVGVGSIGERHLRCFQATGRATVSLCEINPDLRTKVAQRYHVDTAHEDLQAALAQAPDAAVIATPAHLHVPMAIQLATAGVDLLIEKPLSTNLERIDALEETLQQNDRKVAVAYVLRHQPALIAMRDAIRSGRFGRPVELVAVTGQHFPTYRPAYRETYYANRETGGGAIQDALTHLMNAAQWLVGPTERLVADAAHQVLDGVDVEDTVHVLARHGTLLASYTLNQHQAPNEFVVTVVCERATCRLELHEQRWKWMDAPDSPWQTESFVGFERDDGFIAQANAFLDLLDGIAKPACTLAEAIDTLRTNLAVIKSVHDGNWQRTGCA